MGAEVVVSCTPGVAMVTWTGRPAKPRPTRGRHSLDPFCALEVQLALTRVEREIAELECEDGRFARAHHLIAARLAYDQLLGEACRLAGVGSLPEPRRIRRLVAEAELRTRGWTW